ncbi:LysR family transcriptional regulator [Propylenella binzhouense]|uniref:LysR family transcriptional regulator n=1 Tax=Propylenella binzhouense TaxID=2555902 RepID=A0A964WT28_9HYPH|nr:LysR family transcriptional regulator [Propylenella binzhouense]MYZ47587.1 LysR family transcriptional regulator [Propylenella binzhouense]
MRPPLRAIGTFVRCAEIGSFSKAALELGMTPQAVSGQIKQLEDWVQVRLFHRTTRKISLTEEGASFFEHCKSGMETIDDGVRALREATSEAVGTVRLAMPYVISRGYITPLLGRFFDLYPRVSIELIVQNQNPDVVEQSVDLGIGSGPMPKGSIIARRLASVELVLCAAPAYLERFGTPASIADLKRHRCVALRHPRTGKIMPWTFKGESGTVTLDLEGCLTTNDTDTQRQAVLSGVGIGQLASFYVAPNVRAGLLSPLLIGYTAPPYHFYLYMLKRTKIPLKTRVLADYLYRELRSLPDFQSGTVR